MLSGRWSVYQRLPDSAVGIAEIYDAYASTSVRDLTRMASSGYALLSLAIFCKVVDNYGDIGICWRLSRQLHDEHGVAVTLWVDDMHSFQRICPAVISGMPVQEVAGVTVRHWHEQAQAFSADQIADIVIEFFGCEIPEQYVAAMAAMTAWRAQPVWLNLEGLSAEAWVEGCHRLPSPHPRLPLTKHFFFPGFTAKTGGLLHEATLPAACERFQADQAGVENFLAQLGVTPREAQALKVSLFCYPHAPVAALFCAWQADHEAITCLVPEGVATPAIEAFLNAPALVGAVQTKGALTVRVIPFLPQPDYDRLLWTCALNFVRGEDSFVRAQWAGRPFIWHIYPQDKNLHHVKLRAFLHRRTDMGDGLAAATLRWNEVPVAGEDVELAWPNIWQRLRAGLPGLSKSSAEWTSQMLANGDLASNLLTFAATLRQFPSQKPE